MKKIILILILMLATFMSVSSVNALEISCSTSKNLLKPNNFVSEFVYPSDNDPGYIGYYDYSYNGLIPVKPLTSYTYENNFVTLSSPRRVAVVFYDQDFHFISYINNKVNLENHNLTFTTPANTYYITLHLYNISLDTLNSSSTSYQLEKGKSITEYVAYEQCPVEEPEPEPLPVDTTLDNFYFIYLTKLTDLSQFAIENKYVLSAIVIVFLFVCLSLFLHLIGRRKY